MKHLFEHRHQPLLPKHLYLRRVIFSILLGVGLIIISLMVGMAGYHWYEDLPWLDAFVNAAMILSGMGPLAQPHTDGGKIFAGIYALYSGLAVILIAGVIFAPIVHRFLHRFHVGEGKG